WTEGNNGLGWVPDAIPTLKSGSGFGIPSPPAVWVPATRRIMTPDLLDAERLQGFPVGWTAAVDEISGTRKDARWRLVGNAVSVPVAKWLGERLSKPGQPSTTSATPLDRSRGWPEAAWGSNGKAYRLDFSQWPVGVKVPRLLDFLQFPMNHLS